MTLDELVDLILLRLQGARTNAGLTQRDVADLLNVDAVTVSRWETGTRGIDLPLFIRLCALYHVSPALILAGETQSPETRLLQLKDALRGMRRTIDDLLSGERDLLPAEQPQEER